MLNMKLEILFFLTLCAIFNNQPNFVKALLGPNVRSAEENEFPFVVSIMRVRNSSQLEELHRCTGSLVSKQDVLTAEHCLRNTLTEGFKVMIGSFDLTLGSPYYPLFCLSYEHWALNKQRTMTYVDNDISFVKIIGDVPDHIPFAPLGNAPSNTLSGMDVVTAGWGLIENNTIPRILQTVPLKIITNSECEHKIFEIANDWIYIYNMCLCTVGNPHAQMNKGDSGGPLLFFGTLIAVNSGVCPCDDGVVRPNQVNIHFNVHVYREYTQDVITTFHMNY